jgi:NADPH-dependent curcumin reductase CurA
MTSVSARTSRRVTLVARPQGMPRESDFALEEGPVGEPGPGEVLVRSLWVSLDPYQRGRMSEARSYAASLQLGDTITSQAVGEVVESGDRRFEPGDLVLGQLGLQEHAVVRAGSLRPVPGWLDPPSLALHAVGMTGLTAYFGLFDVCRPLPGDTVVVSAAHGAVGQVVGQLAKLAGCRTVGIAGGPEKVRELKELYRYDEAIDYKSENVGAALKEAAPGGVDVYFDNVGGEITIAVARRLAVGARIAVCGQISQYNLEREGPAMPGGYTFLIVARARMQGFLVTDYAHRYDEALPRLAGWVADGSIRWREDVVDGLENAPRAFIGLMKGENRGKLLVKVADRS